MTMRVVVMAMALLAGAMPLSAQATDEGLDKKLAPTVQEAFEAINSGNPGKALSLIEPVLVQYQAAYATEKRKIYCAEGPSETILYMAMAATAKTDAVAINPGWCTAQYVRAFALVDLGRLDDAQAGFEKLLEFSPQHARYWSELGFVFGKQRKWKESADAYTHAVEAADLMPDPKDREHCVALRGGGYALIELGQWDEAETLYKKCLKIEPGEPKSLNELEYIKQQRRKRA